MKTKVIILDNAYVQMPKVEEGEQAPTTYEAFVWVRKH